MIAKEINLRLFNVRWRLKAIKEAIHGLSIEIDELLADIDKLDNG